MGAMSISMAASQVLFGHINWQALLIVALGTHATYSMDNLVDWTSEQHLLQAIQPYRRIYIAWCIITIPLSMIVILLLAFARGKAFALMLAGLGLFCGLIIFMARQPYRWLEQTIFYWGERLLVALTWALITTLVPMRYADEAVTLQVILAIVFIWMISWVVVVVWRFTSEMAVQKNGTTYQPLPRQKKIIQIMIGVSSVALLQAIFDTIVGFFPWLHLSVVLLPAFCIAFLAKWHFSYQAPLEHCNLFFAVLILTLFIITGIHAWFG